LIWAKTGKPYIMGTIPGPGFGEVSAGRENSFQGERDKNRNHKTVNRGEIRALVPAAGLSSRMGDFKPLLDLGGKPLIVRTVESLFRGGLRSVTVVLGFRGDEIENILRGEFAGQGEGRELRFVWNRNFAGSDMLASIKLGLEAWGGAETEGPWFLLPADMPAVRGETLRGLANFALANFALADLTLTNCASANSSSAEFTGTGGARGDSPGGLLVTFPTDGGSGLRRGHPPLIEAPCIPLILNWREGGGLRGFWKTLGRGIALFPAGDEGCFMDADTPADYLRLKEYWSTLDTPGGARFDIGGECPGSAAVDAIKKRG
jgi:CTP:molybdopterin cytidylyltransferase MocA